MVVNRGKSGRDRHQRERTSMDVDDGYLDEDYPQEWARRAKTKKALRLFLLVVAGLIVLGAVIVRLFFVANGPSRCMEAITIQGDGCPDPRQHAFRRSDGTLLCRCAAEE